MLAEHKSSGLKLGKRTWAPEEAVGGGRLKEGQGQMGSQAHSFPAITGLLSSSTALSRAVQRA